jgi:hypothetical protein
VTGRTSCPGDAVTTDHLEPVALDELMERAALLTRVDRKYVLPLAAADDLLRRLAAVAGGARVLDVDGRRTFAYRSVYLDTPDLLTYRQAAHRRARRFKVRTRSYLDSDEHWLEVKVRDRRGRTVKERLLRTQDAPAPADDDLAVPFTRDVLAHHHQPLPDGLSLRPVLTATYRRATVWLPGDDTRLTLDTVLACRGGTGTAVLPLRAVVETKTRGSASAADHLLWAAGHRPVRISKYATAMAALDTGLPANRWTPVLRRHPFVVHADDRPVHTPAAP